MKRIDDIADRLREQLGIPDDVRPSSLDVLRRLKISKVIADFREDTNLPDKNEARWEGQERAILFAPKLWRQIHEGDTPDARFTVFHEIGHAVLGHDARNRLKSGKLQFGRLVESDEMEADEFALAFAIPLRFASDLKDASNPEITGEQFGLSPFMASRRLVDLQRVLRRRENEEDNYAEAMSVMRINTLNWNF